MTQEPEQLMELVAAGRRGDPSALEGVLNAVLPDLRAYVRLNCGQAIRRQEEVSDLVQSICREVLEDLGQFEGTVEAQFRRWLFTLSRNKIQERYRFYTAQNRDMRKRVTLHGPASSSQDRDQQVLTCYATFCTPSRHAMAREELQRIETAFEGLPDDYREVITMSCVMAMSHSEIAVEMGRAETAVRKLLSRARARLSRLMVTDGEQS